MKIRVGNKQNSYLNGEWAGHVRKYGKKITSGIRRMFDKKIIKEELDLIESTRPHLPKEYYKQLKRK